MVRAKTAQSRVHRSEALLAASKVFNVSDVVQTGNKGSKITFSFQLYFLITYKTLLLYWNTLDKRAIAAY